jgi:Holliday junction DNA helicase RuvA
VHGVGYLVFCSRRTLDRLGRPGAPAVLLVETHVREDHIQLYGFIDDAERQWFRLLTAVQGVGGRVAQAVLGIAPPDRLAAAVAAQDRALLTRADGVGPKLAGRIVAELRDKVAAISLGPAAAGPDGTPIAAADSATAGAATAMAASAAEDAVSALVNLGYGRADAYGAVAAAAGKLGAGAGIERLITGALKELAL